MDYLQWHLAAFYSSLFATGVVFVYSRFTNPPPLLKWIQLYLLICFVCDSLNAIVYHLPVTKQYLHINGPRVGTTFRLLELVILTEFYRCIFTSRFNLYASRFIQLAGVILFMSVFPESRWIRISNCIIFTIYTALYYNQQLQRLEESDPQNDPLFWISTGFFLYFAAIPLIFLFFEPLAKIDEVAAVTIYIFHNLFDVVKSVCIGLAFFWATKKPAELLINKTI